MNTLRCSDCNYYWREPEDSYPCCQFRSICSAWDLAPCEIDDEPADEPAYWDEGELDEE